MTARRWHRQVAVLATFTSVGVSVSGCLPSENDEWPLALSYGVHDSIWLGWCNERPIDVRELLVSAVGHPEGDFIVDGEYSAFLEYGDTLQLDALPVEIRGTGWPDRLNDATEAVYVRLKGLRSIASATIPIGEKTRGEDLWFHQDGTTTEGVCPDVP